MTTPQDILEAIREVLKITLHDLTEAAENNQSMMANYIMAHSLGMIAELLEEPPY